MGVALGINFTSSWDGAAAITVDGSGDFVSCMMSRCEGDHIEPIHRVFEVRRSSRPGRRATA